MPGQSQEQPGEQAQPLEQQLDDLAAQVDQVNMETHPQTGSPHQQDRPEPAPEGADLAVPEDHADVDQVPGEPGSPETEDHDRHKTEDLDAAEYDLDLEADDAQAEIDRVLNDAETLLEKPPDRQKRPPARAFDAEEHDKGGSSDSPEEFAKTGPADTDRQQVDQPIGEPPASHQDEFVVDPDDHQVAETELAEAMGRMELAAKTNVSPADVPVTAADLPMPIRLPLAVLVSIDYAFRWMPPVVKDLAGYLAISTLLLGLLLWILIYVR